MSLSQTEKECHKSVLENVNGWSSPTAQWKRVPESTLTDGAVRQLSGREFQSLGAATEKRRNDEQQCRCCAGERKEDFVLMIVTNATDYMDGSDEQGRPVDDEKLTNSRVVIDH